MISRERLGGWKFYRFLVFVLVCVAWIFFRAENMEFALKALRSCLMIDGIESFGNSSYSVVGIPVPQFIRDYGGFKLLIGVVIVFVITQIVPNASKIKYNPTNLRSLVLALVLVYCLLHVGKPSPFLYFKF